MKAKTTHILFDCDNTLVLSESLAFEACAQLSNEILASQNIADRYTGEQLLVDFVGKNFRGMLVDLQAKYQFTIPPEELDKYVSMEEDKVIEKLVADLVPCPGANQVLSKLVASNKYTLAVVSSSAYRRVFASLQKASQLPFFLPTPSITPESRIFSAATSLPVPTSKPDPAIYLFACEQLGAPPIACVAVEDSKSGATAAVRAGIPVIGYVGSYEGEEKKREMRKMLEEVGCVGVMEHWDEFEEALERAGCN